MCDSSRSCLPCVLCFSFPSHQRLQEKKQKGTCGAEGDAIPKKSERDRGITIRGALCAFLKIPRSLNFPSWLCSPLSSPPFSPLLREFASTTSSISSLYLPLCLTFAVSGVCCGHSGAHRVSSRRSRRTPAALEPTPIELPPTFSLYTSGPLMSVFCFSVSTSSVLAYLSPFSVSLFFARQVWSSGPQLLLSLFITQ